MGSFSSWVDSHFNLIQTIGIIGSLLTSSVALLISAAAADRDAKASREEAEARRKEAKAREIENLLTNVSHQRDLWADAYMRPELVRLFQDHADLNTEPVKLIERECLNQILVQFQVTWCMAEAGGIVTPEVLAKDMHLFFSRPVPKAVWESLKGALNPRFVEFVERALEPGGHLQSKS